MGSESIVMVEQEKSAEQGVCGVPHTPEIIKAVAKSSSA